MDKINQKEGRRAFGANASGYDEVRPAYPQWMFNLLIQERKIYEGAVTLEIGPGNGLATRVLVKSGAVPLTLIEPDKRFRGSLESVVKPAKGKCRILWESFEESDLPSDSFDLVLIGTAFHWLDPETRVNKLAEITRKGGAIVLLWNVFQDMTIPDPFHEATKTILSGLSSSPSGAPETLPFALDREAREDEFLAGGNFELSHYAEGHWKLYLNPMEVRLLYEGFSSISRLPIDRKLKLLDQLQEIAETLFGGVVVRNMTSPLYVFTRR
jgi:SAM-dependent methyltransferase